jgi:lipoyl(octanoyl) transferase
MDCRLSIDPPAAGAWNMAVDEVLLDWAAHEQGCWLRLYRWTPATLSLGYFQPDSGRAEHPASRNCPVVRRLTGGGAILHDDELTYSLVIPAGHPLAAHRDRLYQAVHLALADALAEMGVKAGLWPAFRPGEGPEPFLCFQRRAPGDLVAGQTKIAGSAQRRRRGAVLQHGSILLGRSPLAPELAGLVEILGRPIGAETFGSLWLPRLAARLQIAWRPDSLTAIQRQHAELLARERYGRQGWTGQRG